MAVNGVTEELDLYEVLGITRGASKAEIKKAYHKSALSSHPDKVAEDNRADAEIRFKAVSQAYEILSDDNKRHLYDTHGMAAFDGGRGGMGGEADLQDILEQMFGMGMGGGGGMPGMGGRGGPGGPPRPRKGANEEKEYEITLEELYTGKTTKFNSTKNVVCSLCQGTGGKEKAQPKDCATCKGEGYVNALRQVAPGLVSQATVACSICSGSGKIFREKDRCKKCKGTRVTQTKKMLELYIPPGAREGQKIVLAGEADQLPDQEPGDIVFQLKESPHEIFRRAGPDLLAELHITLGEALTGFNRVVLTHLDGRGIKLDTTKEGGRVLKPEQVLKIPGEGMPLKRNDAKGDLYLVVQVEFPEDGWMRDPEAVERLRNMLPKGLPKNLPSIESQEDDEVEFDVDANLEEFGSGSDDPRGGAEWEDEEDDGQAQCAQQ